MIITKEELQERINNKETLTSIAKDLEVSLGYLSQLCKKFEITPPPPGRRPGVRMSEEHKRKISEAQRRRIERQ